MITGKYVGLVAVCLAATVCARAWGGIAVTDQSRFVSITVHGTPETNTAGAFADFDKTVHDTFDANGRHEESSAHQTSSVSLSGQTLHVTANGEISLTVGEFGNPPIDEEVETRSSYSVTFTLDAPATYTLTEQSSLQTDSNGSVGPVAFRGSQLLQGGTNLLPQLMGLSSTAAQTFTGTLAAGTYTYSGLAGGNSDVQDTGSATFSTDFTLTSAATSAVPLPASVWMALTALPLAAVAVRRRAVGAGR